MNAKLPLEAQRIDFTISFAAACKIDNALESVIRKLNESIDYHRRDANNKSNSNVYINLLMAKTATEERTQLQDLQRSLTFLMDSVADSYADAVLDADKRPSKLAEDTVTQITQTLEQLGGLPADCLTSDVHTPIDIHTDNL